MSLKFLLTWLVIITLAYYVPSGYGTAASHVHHQVEPEAGSSADLQVYTVTSNITVQRNETLQFLNQIVMIQSLSPVITIDVYGRMVAYNCTLEISNQSFSNVRAVEIMASGVPGNPAVISFLHCDIKLDGIISGNYANVSFIDSNVSSKMHEPADSERYLSLYFQNTTFSSLNSTFSGLYSQSNPPWEASGHINLQNAYFSSIGTIPVSSHVIMPAYANYVNVSLRYFINGNSSAGDYINSSYRGEQIDSEPLKFAPNEQTVILNFSVDLSSIDASTAEVCNSSLFHFTAEMGQNDYFELISLNATVFTNESYFTVGPGATQYLFSNSSLLVYGSTFALTYSSFNLSSGEANPLKLDLRLIDSRMIALDTEFGNASDFSDLPFALINSSITFGESLLAYFSGSNVSIPPDLLVLSPAGLSHPASRIENDFNATSAEVAKFLSSNGIRNEIVMPSQFINATENIFAGNYYLSFRNDSNHTFVGVPQFELIPASSADVWLQPSSPVASVKILSYSITGGNQLVLNYSFYSNLQNADKFEIKLTNSESTHVFNATLQGRTGKVTIDTGFMVGPGNYTLSVEPLLNSNFSYFSSSEMPVEMGKIVSVGFNGTLEKSQGSFLLNGTMDVMANINKVRLSVRFLSLNGTVPVYETWNNSTFSEGTNGVAIRIPSDNVTNEVIQVSPESEEFLISGGAWELNSSSENKYKAIHIVECGLPGGTPWGVTVNGEIYLSLHSINITVSEGALKVVPIQIRGYTSHMVFANSSGTTNITIIYERIEFTLTVFNSGIPMNTRWSIAEGNLTISTTSNAAKITLPEGFYRIQIEDPTGYVSNQTTLLVNLSTNTSLKVHSIQKFGLLFDLRESLPVTAGITVSIITVPLLARRRTHLVKYCNACRTPFRGSRRQHLRKEHGKGEERI
ncbi:hypothetical protein ApAK_04215 [Thermoplasmatales archaeon AK]|nr:hypothetical protein [Thermoplasmatales archaeon AK]